MNRDETLDIIKGIGIILMVVGHSGGIISGLNTHIPFWPQGGYREMMAVFFLGMGYMLRKHEWWKSNYMMFFYDCHSSISSNRAYEYEY